jgi:membrane peptidoglycan carboxypeptidase
VFRSVRPRATPQQLAAFLAAHLPGGAPDAGELAGLYDKYGPESFSLDDRAFLADVHPLELWLVAYLQVHPGARRSQVLQDSVGVRQEAYRWLFKTRNQHAQNARIRILLEEDAFDRIWEDWRRQGYPFGRLVPSLATAIGSSGDRPDALAELMGIILDHGLRQPTIDLRRLRFAAGTPYETTLIPQPPAPEQALDPLVADTVRQALTLTVELGTAQRLRGVYRDSTDTPIAVGGKTGTGDNRFDVFAPGHRLIESRAVDRTATFVFYLGDRYFGTVTAYVPGPAAAGFEFTSALAVELLAQLEPQLRPLLFPEPGPSCPQCYQDSADTENGPPAIRP